MRRAGWTAIHSAAVAWRERHARPTTLRGSRSGAAGAIRGACLTGPLLGPGAATEDRGADALPADHIVVVACVIHPCHPAVHHSDGGVTVGAAPAKAEPAANDGKGDLRAASPLVLVFVGVKHRARSELLGPGRNACTRL